MRHPDVRPCRRFRHGELATQCVANLRGIQKIDVDNVRVCADLQD